MSALLRATGLDAGYNGLSVVHGIDLELHAGEVVALVGPNGAGKTTTLLTLSSLIAPLGGEVEVLGRPLEPPSSAQKLVHRGLGHVPEDRALFRQLTVAQHLALRSRDGDRAERVYDLFPQLLALRQRKVGLLSGGEQQMVAIGRALMGAPEVLLVDEMSMGLAPLVVQSLLRTVRRLADEEATAVLIVEQHVTQALQVADRGYVMSRGRIAMQGSSQELLADPEAMQASYLGDTD